MSNDIRLYLDFLTHRKRKKLHKILGSDGVLALIDLWLSVASQRPSGELTGYTKEDIEADANWQGEEGLFVKALIESRFLDEQDGVYKLHNWDKRQSWVVQTEDRGDKARFSRLAQVNRELYKQLQADGITSLSKEEYEKLTTRQQPANGNPANAGESPAPSPSLTPNVNKEKENTKEKLLSYLNAQIEELRLEVFKEKILKFVSYRKTSLDSPYRSPEGIDGLLNDAKACISSGYDLSECIDLAMSKEWKNINPTYFEKRKPAANHQNSDSISDEEYEAIMDRMAHPERGRQESLELVYGDEWEEAVARGVH